MGATVQLHHLKAFLVLAQELNFRRAAERLALTQPGLSDQIRQLERELRVALFRRDRSGTRLSPAGRRLLPLASDAVGSVEDLISAAHAITPSGLQRSSPVLRVGMVVDGIGDGTWPLLQAFHQLRPEVRLDIRSLSFIEGSVAIDRGTVDVVLKMGPSNDTELQQVIPIRDDQMSAIVPANSPLTREETVELEVVARRMTFQTPIELGDRYSRHWTLRKMRDAAPSRSLSVLRDGPSDSDLNSLVNRFMQIGGVALWPAGLPVPSGVRCVELPLDRPFHSPREIVINRRSDHALAFAACWPDFDPSSYRPE
jgi:DNA-binding transcriptional LysR family regulator